MVLLVHAVVDVPKSTIPSSSHPLKSHPEIVFSELQMAIPIGVSWNVQFCTVVLEALIFTQVV